MTPPTPPIELTGSRAHLTKVRVDVTDAVVTELHHACPTTTAVDACAEASRDWWPLAMHWSLAGRVPQVAAAVCSPTTTEEVAAVVRVCRAHGVPVTAAGGRSGVCGASVPVFGGVLLDLSALQGVVSVDAISGVVEVLAGTFGPDLERELAGHGQSVGHFQHHFGVRVAPRHLDGTAGEVDRASLVEAAPAVVGPGQAGRGAEGQRTTGLQQGSAIHQGLLRHT